jgi:hypothetical protein
MVSDWKTQIPGCFGEVDKIFATHSQEHERAFALLQFLWIEGVNWSDFEAAFQDWMIGEGCPKSHVAAQMDAVIEHFKPWLCP